MGGGGMGWDGMYRSTRPDGSHLTNQQSKSGASRPRQWLLATFRRASRSAASRLGPSLDPSLISVDLTDLTELADLIKLADLTDISGR